jgi:predicted DNA-binding protein (MmcQ/YjbR family)
MNIDWLRRSAKTLPHTTESVQWGSDLVFKVGGKMYAVAALEPGPMCLSLKCTPEEFAELTQMPGIIPAPYLARAYWIALEHEDALPRAEIKRLLKQSYELVVARLPKTARAALFAPSRSRLRSGTRA